MRTLAGRVTLLTTLAAALVFAVVGALLLPEVGRRERATVDRGLQATATRLQPTARRALLARGLGAQLDRGSGGLAVRLVADGETTYDDGRADGVPIPANTGLTTVQSANGKPWRVIVRSVRPRIAGRLVIAAPLADVQARISDLQRTIALAAALGLLVTALAVRVLTVRALRPLGRLRESAARVSSTRDLTMRVETAGPAEVHEVSESLNAMLARLETSVAATERFTADAGHELRTPLTSLRANVAALRRAPDPSALADIERDVARLTALLDGLQALARGDAGVAAREPVDVADIADAALADARRRHPEVDFAFGEVAELVVAGDANGLRAAADNLLENAARHGAHTVRIGIVGNELRVDDDGPGIPPPDRERLFERFTRGRTTHAPGSGLGLAIVAQQAALHGGSARIEDSPLGGTRVLVTLNRT